MEAKSREEVFTALRSRGIRPIKVVAADGTKANGEVHVVGIRKRIALMLAILASLASFVLAIKFVKSPKGQDVLSEPKPAQTFPVKELPRQEIAGDRFRIEHVPANLFPRKIERYLSQFAEPGRAFDEESIFTVERNGDDILIELEAPILASSNELTEYLELKRITFSLKREMLNFIRGGGTVEKYFEELVKRQKLEISYREKSENRLKEMLSDSKTHEKVIYNFWLKANARLQSMGIYPIPLPEMLRDYQLSLDLDE